MSLRAFLLAVRRRWPLLVIPAVLGIVLAGAFTVSRPQLHQSTTQIYVSATGSADVNQLTAGSAYTQQVVASYARLSQSEYVMRRVIRSLQLDTSPAELSSQVQAVVEDQTSLIDIVVLDEDPAVAARVANAIPAQLDAAVPDLVGTTGTATALPIRITRTQTAVPDGAVASPSLPTNLVAGLLGGILVGLVLLLLRELLDTRVRSGEALSEALGRPLIGEIPRDRVLTRSTVIVDGVDDSVATEAFGRLRANIRFLRRGDAALTAVITSALPGEGKSTVSSNLAVALARSGLRTVLVDADLRRPRLAPAFGVDGTIGLTDVLGGGVELDDALQLWGDALALLPAGEVPPNPAELLQSAAMTDLVAELSSRYDIVLFDSAPVLAVADTVGLADLVQGAIVVGSVRRIRRPEIERVVQTLEGAGVPLLGVVASMVAPVKSQVAAYEEYRRTPAAAGRAPASQPVAAEPDSAGAAPVGPSRPDPETVEQTPIGLLPREPVAASPARAESTAAKARPKAKRPPRRTPDTKVPLNIGSVSRATSGKARFTAAPHPAAGPEGTDGSESEDTRTGRGIPRITGSARQDDESAPAWPRGSARTRRSGSR